MNKARQKRSGQPSFDEALRGIDYLRTAKVEFSVISVVTNETFDHAAELYRFLSSLKPRRININVEEREGVNRNASVVASDATYHFWRTLFQEWRNDPRVPIREFEEALGWMQFTVQRRERSRSGLRDVWPTIAYNGDIFLLSPEFMAADHAESERFCVGNVYHADLDEVVENAGRNWYVSEFEDGIAECSRTCAYFDYCRGGHASNKYYETGSLRATETDYCRNRKIALINAVLDEIEDDQSLIPSLVERRDRDDAGAEQAV